MASRVERPQQGVLWGKARPLTQDTPMRTPVKEPGPSATATAVTSVTVLPHWFSRSWAMTIRVWLWVSPVFW